jgi:DNA polymerase-3 subunit delta'
MPRFADIRGQERVHEALRTSARRERLPHAYLFHGTRGVGKTSTAFALGQFLNCESPTADDSCGTCSSCSKISRLVHPDVHWIFPMAGSMEGKKFRADQRLEAMEAVRRNRTVPWIHALEYKGAAYIAIGRDEETRRGSLGELRWEAGMAPVEGRIKVYVVSEAERMRPEAANSLLKVLEEPPASNLIVLTTSDPRRLLPTILSRCHQVRFGDLSEAVLTELLLDRGLPPGRNRKQAFVPEPANAALAAALAGGSLSRAAKLAAKDKDETSVAELRDQALEFFALRPTDPGAVSSIHALAGKKDRDLVRRILDLGALWQADLLRVVTGSEVPLANRDREVEVRREAAGATVDDIRRRMDALAGARQAMEGNVLLPLLLLDLLAGFHGRVPVRPTR